ncbi:hypothetical protein JWH11_02910 [Xanthomonas melonis]|uniref:Uncharacterized protein n=1 Tax=Xanthomonas melonis TaxID=56456 RepID=A0ABS8NQR8_9XANT|nr:hypothetical protein [Xanthomonas melonis]MCD0245793.1 hypothetical protein [Xanthomonas melonis]MCD0257183.1 hypothetical protein [Xanthomonas melonis]MCD0265402.1 hypothetical protein [Xanthomonas melonis]MCD0280028.1 hypothetical protein [Xanthomonas melonis]
MKSTFIAVLLTVCTVASGSAQAQSMDANALAAAATGERFQSGKDMFRMLPGTVIDQRRPATAAPQANLARTNGAMAPPAGKVAARIGPYAIVLSDSPANAPGPRASANRASGAERTIAAAVNERTGRAVLVRPQVKLTGTTPATANVLASSTNGSITYASTIDGSAVISYPSIEQAQGALVTLQRSSGIAGAWLVVQQSVMEPN